MDTAAPLLGEPIAVELMNTVWADRRGVHDALTTPKQAVAWLRAIRPQTAAMIAAEPTAKRGASDDALLRRLSTLRDALRRLAAEATGDPHRAASSSIPDLAAAVEELNIAAAAAPSWSRLLWSANATAPSRSLHAAATADEALTSQIAENGIELFAGDGRHQLRACLGPGCVLYFIKNHPRREWCSATCGNRARVARHYRRHHGNPER